MEEGECQGSWWVCKGRPGLLGMLGELAKKWISGN